MNAAAESAQPTKTLKRVDSAEAFLRERLNLPAWALNHVPMDLRMEVARVVICDRGCADDIAGKQQGRDMTYRQLFRQCFGTDLRPLP